VAKHHYQRLSLTPSKPPSRRDPWTEIDSSLDPRTNRHRPLRPLEPLAVEGSCPDVTYSTAQPVNLAQTGDHFLITFCSISIRATPELRHRTDSHLPSIGSNGPIRAVVGRSSRPLHKDISRHHIVRNIASCG
jgi:hypothetical protein